MNIPRERKTIKGRQSYRQRRSLRFGLALVVCEEPERRLCEEKWDFSGLTRPGGCRGRAGAKTGKRERERKERRAENQPKDRGRRGEHGER